VPSYGGRLVFSADRDYECTTTPWSGLTGLVAPTLPAAPPANAAAPTSPGSCEVFHPGTYTAGTRPSWGNNDSVYFKPGVYYFDNVGTIDVRNNSDVVAGVPGRSELASAADSLSLPACAAEMAGDIAASAGGVVFIMGGNSRFDMGNNSDMEIFAPAEANGIYSIVGLKTVTNGFSVNTVNSNLIAQSNGTTLLIHGGIHAQTASLTLMDTKASGQVFGPVIIGMLTLQGVATGYNTQADTVEVLGHILVEATGPSATTLRVVADVIQSGQELGINSWRFV
jgi:hypothetical protein